MYFVEQLGKLFVLKAILFSNKIWLSACIIEQVYHKLPHVIARAFGRTSPARSNLFSCVGDCSPALAGGARVVACTSSPLHSAQRDAPRNDSMRIYACYPYKRPGHPRN